MSADRRRSSRPVWLGPIRDERRWDHVRLHVDLLADKRLGDARSEPRRSVVLAVYFGLAMHAELGSGESYPSAETLGMYAGCDERTARKATRVLVSAGWIAIEKRPGKASVYRLLSPPVLSAENMTAGVVSGVRHMSAGATPAHPGNERRTSPEAVPDEQEPRNQSQEQEGVSSSRAPETGSAPGQDEEDPRVERSLKLIAEAEWEAATDDRWSWSTFRRRRWFETTADDLRDRHSRDATAFLTAHPDASAEDIAAHLEPDLMSAGTGT